MKPELLEFQNRTAMTNSSLMGRLSPSSLPLRVHKLLSPVLEQLITVFCTCIYIYIIYCSKVYSSKLPCWRRRQHRLRSLVLQKINNDYDNKSPIIFLHITYTIYIILYYYSVNLLTVSTRSYCEK